MPEVFYSPFWVNFFVLLGEYLGELSCGCIIIGAFSTEVLPGIFRWFPSLLTSLFFIVAESVICRWDVRSMESVLKKQR